MGIYSTHKGQTVYFIHTYCGPLPYKNMPSTSHPLLPLPLPTAFGHEMYLSFMITD